MAARAGVGIIGRFFGRTVSEAAAFGAGVALGPVLGPPTQALRNEVNSQYPFVPPPAVTVAHGVASGQVDPDAARTWAREQGYGDAAFDALVAVNDTGPGLAYAFELWRRGLIDDAAFRRAAKREALEPEWIDALAKIKARLLTPDELANAVVQGHRDFADALADAELQGISPADFQTMVDNTGLPPGPETLLAWLRRGIVDEGEFAQGIREGHTKTKYVEKYLAALAPVLSARDYAGLFLRGWITEAEMNAGGKLTGYTPEQMQMLFLNRGRPATPRQIRIGYARGARIAGFTGDVDAAIDRATRQSDIRTEYEAIEREVSWSYPSPFVLRALAQDGTFDQATTERILHEMGWKPEYARLTAQKWSQATGAEGKALKLAELKDSYIAGFMDENLFRQGLTNLGYTGADQDMEVLLAEVAAIKTARGAAVTKLRNMYEKGTIEQAAFAGSLAALGMHQLAIDREVTYANVVKGV